jgi:hypothetical protein
MLTRTHDDGQTSSEAVYSDCERYRYSLTRVWEPAAARLAFIMLNPSVADERQNDPTVERCEQRARRWGYGSFRVVNIFAWRATDPLDMRRAVSPEGPGNGTILAAAAYWADLTIAAWGVHGAHLDQGRRAARDLRRSGVTLYHLGLTQAGHPRHPLYLPYAREPEHWVSPYPD